MTLIAQDILNADWVKEIFVNVVAWSVILILLHVK